MVHPLSRVGHDVASSSRADRPMTDLNDLGAVELLSRFKAALLSSTDYFDW
jgi:hypothetical protein